MPNNVNDNDQTKLYRSTPSDDQPTFRRPYPQPKQQQQYQNPQQNGSPYSPRQNYQQGGYPQQQNQAPPLQNYYAPPQYQQPQYQQPYYPPDDRREEKEKSGSGIIILLIITLLLILAVVGGGIYMYMKNNSSGGSGKSSSDTGNVIVDSQNNSEEDTSEEDTTDEPAKIVVPELRGSDQLSAERELLEAGLRCSKEYEFSDSVNEDVVISQSIPVGTEVDEDTVITIVISQGRSNSEKVMVPNVTGLSYEAAQKELEKAGLIATATYTPNDKVARDFVISQDTEPGTEIYKGSLIKLTVSQGKYAQPATETPTAANSNSNGSKKYGTVNTEETDLNVRKTPSTNGEKIGSLPKGTKIEIIGSEGNWYKIVYNGTQAYVSKDYVKLEN